MVPDWVIDAKQGCIVPDKSVERYAALSLGTFGVLPRNRAPLQRSPPNRLLLQHSFAEDLSIPEFPFSDHVFKQLPTVVRDSVLLVAQSDARHLWVDCLCILQNDEFTKDEAAVLPELYSGAVCNIIAAANGDGMRRSPDDDNKSAHMVDEAAYLRRRIPASRFSPEEDWNPRLEPKIGTDPKTPSANCTSKC